ncbi:hypothetical protein HII13_004367 [Brettanomyces bruxellensis]|nr:hypothetical protein HII13_004367 [Brettanomyces bruxellensis]
MSGPAAGINTSTETAVSVTSENFELWIRMATDNKINSTNSWDFALIDYFHDLSMFKEGDGINFQKASTTLDGCVKIYSSRIDSAATETGRLLSGLSSSELPGGKNDGNNASEEESDDDDDVEKRREQQRKYRRNRARNTLVSNFDQIKAKSLETQFLQTPFSKKALSDFDEGGSKSLLMNMLKMSSQGQVMFVIVGKTPESVLNPVNWKDDSAKGSEYCSDTQAPISPSVPNNDMKEQAVVHIITNDQQVTNIEEPNVETGDNTDEVKSVPTSVSSKGISILGDMALQMKHDAQICPSLNSLKGIDAGDTSVTQILDQIGDISSEPEEGVFNENENAEDGFDFDTDKDSTGNSTKINRSQYSLFLEEGMGNDDQDSTFRSLNLTGLFDENATGLDENNYSSEAADDSDRAAIAKYFDKLSGDNWRGPEYWKISKVKTFLKDEYHQSALDLDDKSKLSDDKRIIPKKLCLPRNIFKPGQISKIMLPEKEMEVNPEFNCLPEDFKFTTKRLICLNLKPDIFGDISREDSTKVADESFFADVYKDTVETGVSDDDFFGGDNDNDMEFGNEDMNDGMDPNVSSASHKSGYDDLPANNVDEFEAPVAALPETRKHTNGLTYARKSKRVDIRMLKERLWTAIGQNDKWTIKKRNSSEFKDDENSAITETDKKSGNDTAERNGADAVESKLKLSEIVRTTADMYDPRSRKDLSTSFYFICLLHLANENNLSLEGTMDRNDIIISR